MIDEDEEMSEVDVKLINKQVAANADTLSSEDKHNAQKMKYQNMKQQQQQALQKGKDGKKAINDFDN